MPGKPCSFEISPDGIAVELPVKIGQYGYHRHFVGDREVDGFYDRRGRICTTCNWYKPWRDFWSRKQATCKACIALNGATEEATSTAKRADVRFKYNERLTVGEWEAIKKQWGNRCLRCNRPEGEVELMPDHVIPVRKGGSGRPENIQPLCRGCNSAKRDKSTDYRISSHIRHETALGR